MTMSSEQPIMSGYNFIQLIRKQGIFSGRSVIKGKGYVQSQASVGPKVAC